LSRHVSLGAALFFALLAAALIVAVLVVRARTPDLVLEVTELDCRLNPGEHPDAAPARITFFVRESDDDARVAIVDRHEQLVRTLDSTVALDAGEPVTYSWDGRTDAGAVVAPGRYRLEVALPGQRREMVWPRRIFVDLPDASPDCAGPRGRD
jgi:hypothetical protein